MKAIFLFAITFYTSLVFCLEIPFEKNTAEAYYSKSKMVFLGLKLSEPFNYEEFSDRLNKYSIFDEKKIKDLWASQSKWSRYLVIKIYKGEIGGEGKVSFFNTPDGLTSPRVGSLNILFSDGNKFVDWCNAFSFDGVPKEKRESILNVDVDELIDFLVSNKLHYCLNPPETRFE